MPKVAVIIGSRSDLPYAKEAVAVLQEMGMEFELRVISAHRTPERAREYGQTAEARGIDLFIAMAGAAAHLPGVLASWTPLPVIGVPLPATDLNGVDALHAIVQMPAGVPVAAVAIGTPGARNAAYLAAEMLGIKYPAVRERYKAYRARLAEAPMEVELT